MFFVICHPTILQKLVPWKQICFYPIGHFIQQVRIFPIPIIIDPQLTFCFPLTQLQHPYLTLQRFNSWLQYLASLSQLALSSLSSDSSSDISSRCCFPPLVRDIDCRLFAMLCLCRHFSLWWKLWSQWGKLIQLQKKLFQIQFFVFTNGGNDSNFDSVVFSCSVKKISAYEFLFNICLQMYWFPVHINLLKKQSIWFFLSFLVNSTILLVP